MDMGSLPKGDGISVASLAGKPKSVVTHATKEIPIVQSAEVHPSTYVGAASGSNHPQGTPSAPTKGKSNFRALKVDNLFNGVDVSIPLKVVQNISTKFDNTLYGYFIG